MPRHFTVIVEGNIGCGKSTFLRYFDQLSTNVEVIQEPIFLWKDVRGYNLFDLMYQDYARWAIPFQAQVMVTSLDRQIQPQVAPVRLIERSLYSCRYCFTENMHIHGSLSTANYKALDNIFKWSLNERATPVDLIVYLRSSPRVCFDRVQLRHRSGEDSISLVYLEQLNELHEAWLMEGRFGSLPAPLLVFDCDVPLPKLTTDFDAHQLEVMCGVPLEGGC
ncbi:unnamed protein product [Calicophoron daubneyi]|uniref:Deoxynucleoside kinase domain-containing protein n=1 Tax=Calicophoron daubneyi TaxID=300641 RepID=A0AAV2T267_CALDB